MHIVLIHSEYWLNRQTARMLYLPWKWYRHGHHLTPSPLLSIALRYCVYCIRAGLLNNAVPNHCTYRISRAQTADQKYWENKSTEQTQKGKIERKTAKRIEATTSCMCQNKRSHTFGNETNVMRAIRESYYMCTFNNISIKLTLCCVFGAAWTMLFSPTYSVFFSHWFFSRRIIFFSLFLLCPCFDHLLLFFFSFSFSFNWTLFIAFCCCCQQCCGCFQSASVTYSFVSNFVCTFFLQILSLRTESSSGCAVF